jgi:transposase
LQRAASSSKIADARGGMAMEWSDSRTLQVAVLNERRWRAVVLRLAGRRLEQVYALCKLCQNTGMTVVKAYHAGGWNAVAVPPHRGPAKDSGCVLKQEQQQAIMRLIDDHFPNQLDLPFALWSRPAVTALIEREYGIMLPVRTVGAYLKRWGLTPRKPLDRAYEEGPAAVQRGSARTIRPLRVMPRPRVARLTGATKPTCTATMTNRGVVVTCFWFWTICRCNGWIGIGTGSRCSTGRRTVPN